MEPSCATREPVCRCWARLVETGSLHWAGAGSSRRSTPGSCRTRTDAPAKTACPRSSLCDGTAQQSPGAPLVVGADVCHLFSAAGRGGEPLLMASVDGRGVCVFDWSAHRLRLRQQLAQEPLADGVPPGGGQGARVGRIVARHAQVVVVYEREEDGRRRHTASTSTTSSSYLCSSTNGAVCAFFFILQQRTERRCCRGKPPQ